MRRKALIVIGRGFSLFRLLRRHLPLWEGYPPGNFTAGASPRPTLRNGQDRFLRLGKNLLRGGGGISEGNDGGGIPKSLPRGEGGTAKP